MQAASGYHMYWPHGRGIFMNNAKTFLVWINEGDHIRVISMEKGGDILRVFEKFEKGLRTIGQGITKVTGKSDPFLLNPILGYITCCPTNLGTGMRASVHMQLPKLISKIGVDGIEKMASEINCEARGSFGEHSAVVGNRIDISNYRRLGVTEIELLHDVIRCANKLASLEDLC